MNYYLLKGLWPHMIHADSLGKTVRLKDLSRLLRELPKLGAEAVVLGKDLHEIAKAQPPLALDSTWITS
jgi:hypothetical protein